MLDNCSTHIFICLIQLSPLLPNPSVITVIFRRRLTRQKMQVLCMTLFIWMVFATRAINDFISLDSDFVVYAAGVCLFFCSCWCPRLIGSRYLETPMSGFIFVRFFFWEMVPTLLVLLYFRTFIAHRASSKPSRSLSQHQARLYSHASSGTVHLQADARRIPDEVRIKADEVLDRAGGEDHPDEDRHAQHLRLLPPPAIEHEAAD
jgi:hypothetical protein